MSDSQMRAAVVGLGVMGLPIARRLATEFATSAYDRNADRCEQAAAGGVKIAADPASAAEYADVLVVCVRTVQQAEDCLFGDQGAAFGLQQGATVLLMSTVGADQARSLADRLTEFGVELVDAPMSGSPARADEGDLLILVSGADFAVERVSPVLGALAGALVVVGKTPGDGQALKVVNQLLCGAHIAAAAEALRLAEGLGLNLESALDALGKGAAASFMLADRGPRIVEAVRAGTSSFRSRLDIFDKDMQIVADAATAAGLDLTVAAAVHRLYSQAEGAGLGADDDSNVVLAIRSDRPGTK